MEMPAPEIAPQPEPAPEAEIMLMPPPAPMPPPPTDAQSLRVRFGAPDFVRREMDSELWRYDGMGCAIFFFLYRDGDIWRIRFTETEPRGQDMATDDRCVESLNARVGSMF
jgi:hypothetical protein